METSYSISKKIDNNNHFVFIKNSKQFLIVDDLYLILFNDFYENSKNDFIKNTSKKFPDSNANDIYIELKNLLKKLTPISEKPTNKFVIPQNLKKFKFKLGDIYFTINYNDLKIINTVISQLFHLKDNTNIKSKNYYVFEANGSYFLNNDSENIGFWNENEIHYLTGKLLSLIMCDFHSVEEENWSGFLHASIV